MCDSKVQVVRALAEALFPALDGDAELARAASREGMAKLLETSAGSMDFVIDAVSLSCSISCHFLSSRKLVKALL